MSCCVDLHDVLSAPVHARETGRGVVDWVIAEEGPAYKAL